MTGRPQAYSWGAGWSREDTTTESGCKTGWVTLTRVLLVTLGGEKRDRREACPACNLVPISLGLVEGGKGGGFLLVNVPFIFIACWPLSGGCS